jgi:hypothetical protein
LKLTKTQDLFFKAGRYAGKAEVFRLMRSRYCNSSLRWEELNEAVKYWQAKSDRYKKRAEKVAANENDKLKPITDERQHENEQNQITATSG